jgi:hypothetical protein
VVLSDNRLIVTKELVMDLVDIGVIAAACVFIGYLIGLQAGMK